MMNVSFMPTLNIKNPPWLNVEKYIGNIRCILLPLHNRSISNYKHSHLYLIIPAS